MFVFDYLLFMIMYLISFHLVISSDDWFMIWLGLEINMMMFIMLIFKSYSMMSSESCLKYFFIQSLGSAVFIGLFYFNKEYLNMILCMVLSYKIGAGPFFFWFPSVCSGISWMSCFILMSIQKLIPLMLIGMFICWLIFMIIFMGLIIGMLGALNQVDLKQLMAYSSVYHLSWILMCLFFNDMSWFSYMIMYMLLMFPLLCLLHRFDVMNMMDMMKLNSKILLIIMMFSISGMPPFLGFFISWFAFINIIKLSFFYGMILLFSSIIMFYVYFRIIYDALMGYYVEISWKLDFFDSKNMEGMDLVSGLGLFVGLIMGIYFVLCNNSM